MVNKTRLRMTFVELTNGQNKQHSNRDFSCPKARGKPAMRADRRVGVTKVKARGLGNSIQESLVAEKNIQAKDLQSQSV